MKKELFIISILMVFATCDTGENYKIEGELSNLVSPTLYIVFESADRNVVDTVECDARGQFAVNRELNDDIREIRLFYNNRSKSFTIYPELGESVQIKGDADYPRLMHVKGGRINNKLTQFKKKASSLLKELTDIENKQSSMPQDEIPQAVNLRHELLSIVQNFISENPEEVASVILVSEYFTSPDNPAQTEEMLSQLSSNLEDNYYLKVLKMETEKAKATVVGAKAPDYEVKDVYGKSVSPSTFANKYYILAFTAMWCDMCQTEVLMLDDLSYRHSRDSLEMLVVSLDEDSRSVRELLQRDTVSWNLVTDSAGQAINMFEKYNVSSIPSCFLVDRDGMIVLRTSNGAELANKIEEIMK